MSLTNVTITQGIQKVRKGSIERTVLGRRHIVFLGGPRDVGWVAVELEHGSLTLGSRLSTHETRAWEDQCSKSRGLVQGKM